MAKKKKQKTRSKSKKKQEKEEFPIHKIRVKVVGIGGGAGSIIEDIAAQYKNTEFYVADTDQSALSKFNRKKRIKAIRFGEETTRGMGTGMNVEMGRKAAEENREEIKKVLSGADLCIFVSCLGGGTGSGAMPVWAEIAQDLESLSYGFFTLPFEFEREKKLETARLALGELRLFLNAMAVIPNQRVFQVVDEKVPIKKALSSINNAMGSSLEGLIEMIHSPGLINIDFADLETILRAERPLSYLARARAGGKGRVKSVLKGLLDNPLYPYDISGADSILFNISAPTNLSLSEVAEISETIAKQVKEEDSRVIFGVNLVRGKNELDVTLLAVGCELKELFSEATKPSFEKKKRVKVERERLEEGRGQGMKESEESEEKIRKNALEVQKDMKEIEKELLKREKRWESPTFLRKKE